MHDTLEQGDFEVFDEVKKLKAQKALLLKAAKMALAVFHMDSDMEEDFAPEIKELEQAISAANE